VTDRVLTPAEMTALRRAWQDVGLCARIGDLLASHERLRAERDLLRAVVDAAREWEREHFPHPSPGAATATMMLKAAVDAFDKEATG